MLGDITIKEEDFVKTAPAYTIGSSKGVPTGPILNPQTAKLCDILGIDDPLQVVLARLGRSMREPNGASSEPVMLEQCVHSTPQKNARLSLPAPVTPIIMDETADSTIQSDSYHSIDANTSCTDDVSLTPSDCSTPLSGKKTFKRRNQALYTPGEECDVSSSPADDSESPKSIKISVRKEEQSILNLNDS